jgi:hypothetical protein
MLGCGLSETVLIRSEVYVSVTLHASRYFRKENQSKPERWHLVSSYIIVDSKLLPVAHLPRSRIGLRQPCLASLLQVSGNPIRAI